MGYARSNSVVYLPGDWFAVFSRIKKFLAELRCELVTGCTSGGYDQFETSPEAIEQELRPAVCERRQANYSIDTVSNTYMLCHVFHHLVFFMSYLMLSSHLFFRLNLLFPCTCL